MSILQTPEAVAGSYNNSKSHDNASMWRVELNVVLVFYSFCCVFLMKLFNNIRLYLFATVLLSSDVVFLVAKYLEIRQTVTPEKGCNKIFDWVTSSIQGRDL